MKILVASTPKTGNTWVKHLLAAAYGLPVKAVGQGSAEGEFDRLGPNWVTQQHFYPADRLVRWGRDRGLTFVTTVRHPGDVLASLRHYAVHYGWDEELMEAIRRDEGRFGE